MTQAAVKDDTSTVEHAAADAAASSAASMGGWPVDDIGGLARRLPEIDPAGYFDGQAKEAFQQSLIKWPVLARLMKLVPAGEASVHVERNPAQKQKVG